MKNKDILSFNNIIFFEDALRMGHPYVATNPRNHESLFFVKKGNLLYEREGQSEVIREGQVGYIRSGASDVSSAYMCDEVSYYAVNFCFGDASGSLPLATLCSNGSLHYPYATLFKKATLESALKSLSSEYLTNGLLLEIIGYLFKETDVDEENVNKFKRIAEAVEYMKQHSGESELRMWDISRILGMSEKNFRRIFKMTYGQTPYAFLQKFRVEKAEKLLVYTGKSVSEIALNCGFCDVYSFSHCFKRHFGISPQKYRDSSQNKLLKT